MTQARRLTPDSLVHRDPEVIAAEADLDLVMVSISTGYYYGISDVAREIWGKLERPKMISDLVDELVATYNVDRRSCEAQTLEFLDELLKEQLIQLQNEPSN
jgi:hypothetical protein